MEPTPHDAFARAIFGDPRHAAAELQALLPAVWRDAIDWESLVPLEGTVVDEELHRRCADLLFTARRSDGAEALLLFLIEHQSSLDRRMPLRLLGYQTRILERWAVEHPEADRLPALLVLLIHQGPQPWPWPASFAAAMGSALPEAAGVPAPLDFGFLLDDLSRCSDAELLDRGEDAIAKLALVALRRGRDGEGLVARIADALGALADDLRGPSVGPALERLARYVCLASEEPAAAVRRLIVAAVAPEVRRPFMNLADALRAEGKALGKAEGKAEGKAAGELLALRSMLRLQLTERFGSEAERQGARIDGADAATLREWLRRFATASTLAAVFG